MLPKRRHFQLVFIRYTNTELVRGMFSRYVLVKKHQSIAPTIKHWWSANKYEYDRAASPTEGLYYTKYPL